MLRSFNIKFRDEKPTDNCLRPISYILPRKPLNRKRWDAEGMSEISCFCVVSIFGSQFWMLSEEIGLV